MHLDLVAQFFGFQKVKWIFVFRFFFIAKPKCGTLYIHRANLMPCILSREVASRDRQWAIFDLMLLLDFTVGICFGWGRHKVLKWSLPESRI